MGTMASLAFVNLGVLAAGPYRPCGPSGVGMVRAATVDTVRASQFVRLVESYLPGRWLVYSTFTGAFEEVDELQLEAIEAALDTPSLASPELRAWMLERGYLVSFDERAVLRRRYHEGREQGRAAPMSGLSLTIAPTVRCNFGCTYCFEKHPKRDLGARDSASLVKFVESRLAANTYLHVTWFGGEPLLNLAGLERDHDALHAVATARGCAFSHAIITNGSLLTPSAVAFLERTRISYVQVTLDGPPMAHDQRRMRAGGGGTFERIADNLAAAAGRIPITVRVNVDRRNCAELPALLDELERRGLRDGVQVYLGHVAAYTDVCEGTDGTTLSREAFAKLELEFEIHAFRRGFRGSVGLPSPRFGAMCVADNPNGYVVSPSGAVFDCWNETADDPSTARHTLVDGVLVPNPAATRRDWTQYDPFAHRQCQTCEVQPLCRGGCGWEAAKLPEAGPGSCSPLRWNLDERLRLYHLHRTTGGTPAPQPDCEGPSV